MLGAMVAIAAVSSVLLFFGEFDHSKHSNHDGGKGPVFDNWIFSALEMFVFVTGADNWNIVYQGYELSYLTGSLRVRVKVRVRVRVRVRLMLG